MCMANSKLFLNSINIGSAKLGTSDVILYLGEELIYPLGSSVDITYDTATYNGVLQTAQNIVVTDKSGNTLVESVDYVVTENNGGINAGNYPIVISMMGQYQGTARTNFVINKVTPTVSAPTAISGLIYNSSQQALVNAGSTDYGTLKYSTDGTNYSAAIPSGTTAGTHTVYYKVEGDSNVNDVAANSITASIAKVTPTVVAPTAKVLTYNTQAQELVNAGSTDYGTLKYSLNNSTWSTSIPTATNYGSYTVYYKVDGNSNVNDVAAQSVACSINEKQVTATVVLSPTSYTYNGSACQPSVTVKDGSTVIDPSEYTVTYSNNINAGTGTVTISDNVGGNYEVIGSATFTINKANGSVTVTPIAKSITYNGSNQALVTSGSGTGTMLYKLGSGSWSTDIPSGTTAGTYTVYYKASASTNYEESTSGSVNCIITKAESSLLFAVTNITVDVGETKTNAVTVNAGDGTITYSSNDTSIVTVDNNGVVSGVSSGSTTVSANISSTNNYNSASTSYSVSSITWDIVTKFNVTSTTSPTKIVNRTSGFRKIKVDGVELPSVTASYTFSTTGEHTVKYKLTSTSITNDAFYQCSAMTTCTIGGGVTSIGEFAFGYCSGLTSVTIPDSVTNIGQYAFQYCSSITSIDIPNGVTSISYGAFGYCTSLTSCTIGSGVTTIDGSAFGYCSGLTSIDIPNGVTNIGQHAFDRCTSLTSVTIPDSVTTIGGSAFLRCSGLTSVTIPSGVTSIADHTFGGCSSLTSIDIPSGVTRIGESAFSNCSGLTSVTIPSGVTSIDYYVFQNCSGLTSITCNAATPPTLGLSSFTNTNDCPIYVPCDSVDTYKAASGWSTYASRIQAIPGSCPIVATFNVTDTSSPTKIGYNQYISGFSAIEIDGVVQTAVTSSYTFSTTGEHTVKYTLTDPTSIGSYAFNNCTGLRSIDIPSGVTSIGESAFQYCSGLTSITYNAATPPTLGVSSFTETNNCPIYVPCDSVDTYKAATNWSAYASRIQAIPGNCPIVATFNVTNTSNPIRILYKYNDYDTTSFNKIEIDGAVQPSVVSAYTFSTTGEHTVKYYLRDTSIGNMAFYGCSGITSVIIPDGVTSIGSDAFENCTRLTSIVIPDSVRSIGEGAFAYCFNLTSVTIPDGVTSIDDYTFERCGLTSCTIGSGVTSIGRAAFNDSEITNIVISDNVTSIGNQAFYMCDKLTSCTIGSGVTSIGEQSFMYCSGLTSITIEATTPPTLGLSVFDDTNDCPIYVPCDSVDTYKAATNWSDYASRIQAIPGSCS